MPLPRFPSLYGVAAALVALALDQAHKYFMLHVFDIAARAPIRAAPFLDIMLSWNFGVSYSLFSAHDSFAKGALLFFQFAVVAVLSLWLIRATRRITAVALGLIIGGALGNIVDRLIHGAVADFFYLHTTLPVGPLANYVFNVADVAITLGVGLLVVEMFLPSGESAATQG